VQVSIFPNSALKWASLTTVSCKGTHENFYGAHLWWEPKETAFRLRSEFARGHHAQGYWVEADYRTQAFGGLDSVIGRFEPVFRMQQTFRRDTIVSDGLPLVNTQRADFGLDYNLPHNTRILTSYARQFSSLAITMSGRQGLFTASSSQPGKENDDEFETLVARYSCPGFGFCVRGRRTAEQRAGHSRCQNSHRRKAR
jgi:hypothetical protein